MSEPRASKTAQTETLAWRRRKVSRPHEILAAARQLMEENGTAAASIAQIAAMAGVSEATIYKYYASKQDLINHVLAEWAAPFVDRTLNQLRHITDLRSRLSVIADSFLRSMQETPKFHRVVFQELRWSEYQGSAIHRLNQSYVQTVVDTVASAIAAGKVRPEVNPAIVRDMLFGGLEHIALRTSFVDRPLDVDAEVTAYVDIIVRGIEVPTAPGAHDTRERLDTIDAKLDRLMAMQGQKGTEGA